MPGSDTKEMSMPTLEIEEAESAHVAAARRRYGHVDGGAGVDFHEGGQAAGVVAVAVRENGEIDG